jgi:tetratricopeptide (TPR) repeat protein
MLESQAAASRAYSAGRYEEAAGYYANAAQASDRVRDRDEMLFLQACSYQRAGQFKQAREVLERLLKESPNGERSARASFEIAYMEIDHGDEASGYSMLGQFLFRYPDTGLGRPALARYLSWMDNTKGAMQTLAFLKQNESQLQKSGIGEEAVYGQAHRLEQLGETRQARDTYVRCAHDYPYPFGTLFDDALYRASELDEKLGDARLAVEHLQQMLREREKASMGASYERPRYSAAQIRIARLYRDELNEPQMARREFHRLYTDFPTSILRDDALWEEALLAKKLGDQSGACDAAKLLVRDFADSRYSGCASIICADIAPGKRSCRDYIERQVQATQGQPERR